MVICGNSLKIFVAIAAFMVRCGSYDIPKDPYAIAAINFVGSCAQNEIGLVKSQVKRGMDVNVREPRFGRTCLQVAADQGHVEIAKFILTHGGNVFSQDYHKATALFSAVYVARNSKPDTYDRRIVNLLLESGANKTVNIPDENGTTPLYWACRLHDPDIVKILLAYGADPNHEDNGKFWAYSCVQRRSESGNEAERQKANEIWRLLRDKGAKIP